MEFIKVTPILRIFDAVKAREFYLDFLGFSVDWEQRYEAELPLYMQVSRGGLSLHLSEHHGDCTPGVRIIIEMKGIHAYHAELIGKHYGYMRPGLCLESHGAWCMEVTDPFGNRLTFSERVE